MRQAQVKYLGVPSRIVHFENRGVDQTDSGAYRQALFACAVLSKFMGMFSPFKRAFQEPIRLMKTGAAKSTIFQPQLPTKTRPASFRDMLIIDRTHLRVDIVTLETRCCDLYVIVDIHVRLFHAM